MPLAGKYRNAMLYCQLLCGEKVDSLLAVVCPYRCLLCDAPARDMDLCAACRADLPWQRRACRRCALPLPRGELCANCAAQPPRSSACFAALIYEYPVNRMLTALKFGRRSYMARITGELLAAYLRSRIEPSAWPDQVVPVPLHVLRLSERGYNQAELIAATVANCLRLSCRPDLLRRDRQTATQTGLGRARRLRNLDGAFSVCGAAAGMRIALVDDVLTTGATTVACAETLLQAGADDVQIWTVARAI